VRTSIAPRTGRRRRIRPDLRALERAARVASGGFARIQLYWAVGRRVVEEELEAERTRRQQTARLHAEQQQARPLSTKRGAGRAVRHPPVARAALVRQVRAFYVAFPKPGLLRRELDWAHYRALCRLDNVIARHALMNEAAVRQWSAREVARRVRELGRPVGRVSDE
jgi:hypothetical protein